MHTQVFLSMPASLPNADLKTLGPTKDEVAEAKALLKSFNPKEHRSKMASMTAWLSNPANAQPDEEALKSRGDDRKRFLEAWLIHQMRNSKAKKTMLNSKVTADSKTNYNDEVWMNAEMMDDKFGKKKGSKMRSAKVLEVRPCPFTGSEDDDMIEYQINWKWVRKLVSEGNTASVNTEGEATEDDLKILESPQKDPSEEDAKKEQEANKPIKQEKLSKQEQDFADFQQFKAALPTHLRKFQDYDLETRQLMSFLKEKKYTGELQEMLKRQQTRLAKVIALLAKGLQEEVSVVEWRKLSAAMKVLRHSQNEAVQGGVGFGYKPEGDRKRRKKAQGNFVE